MKKLNFLKNPIVVIFSIVLGAIMGVKLPNLALVLAPFGDMYLHLLQMLVIPILVTSIVASIGKLMRGSNIQLVKKILFYFTITIVFTAIFGTIVGIVTQPGKNLSQESKDTLGEYVQTTSFSDAKILEVEIFGDLGQEEVKQNPLIKFITGIVPANIFRSLYTGVAMEVVFFTIILGISIGVLKTRESDEIISVSSSLFVSFQKIMNTTIYFLPFGLMFMVGNQVREVGLSLIYPMFKLILVFYLAGFVFLIINTLLIKYKSKSTLKKTINALGEAMMISFFARNSLAAIPAAVMGLGENLRFERSTCNLLVPLGISLGRYGNIFYFAITSIFVIQLYEIHYGVPELIMVLMGSILAGTATSGATGFATLPLIGIILTPLGIPLEVVLLLLFAIDAIVDPMRTLLIVHANMLNTALVADLYTDEGKDESEKRKINIYQETII